MPRLAPSRDVIESAIGGDRAAVRAMIDFLTPVIQARTARLLLRKRPTSDPRALRPELEDFVQEVLVALFEQDGKLLRRWDETRGLSLANFVGLVTERYVLAKLRTGRHNPWREELALLERLDDESAVQEEGADVEAQVASRELLATVADRLQEELSPLGMQLFLHLHVRQQSVDEVGTTFNLSLDAVYAWRSRIAKRVRRIGAELVAQAHAGPVLSSVEGPALSSVEGPALSSVEGPALSSVEGPALSSVEGPALSSVEGPALSSVEGRSPIVSDRVARARTPVGGRS